MQKKYTFLRAVAWLVCIYHVVLGVALNCPADVIASMLSTLLGATKAPDASALFTARMLGAYMLAFGIGMGVVAWNPIKNRALLTIGCLLVLFRAGQRLLQIGDLDATLGVSPTTNWITIAILLVFAAALAFFRFRVYRDMGMESKN